MGRGHRQDGQPRFASKVTNVTPRYAKLYSADRSEVIGWENIELISDRRFEIWLDEFKRCKDQFPDGVLIASIMEEYSTRMPGWRSSSVAKGAGVDAFELNFSCPHGLPERKMGAAMGQNPESSGRSLRLGHGRGQETCLGEDDAQHHAHRRPEPGGVACRLPRA